MKHGDVVVQIDDVFKVEFQGWIAGSLCTYNFIFTVPGDDFGGRYYKPYETVTQHTGTVSEMLAHASQLVKEYNRTLVNRGGGRQI